MKKYSLTLFLCALFVHFTYTKDVQQLVKDFSGNNWEDVLNAKYELEDYEAKALKDIIVLLDEDKTIKLTNTGDLIYPGAAKFYGHGMIVDYDIDNLIIRAGWLLEEITFENFGFSTIHERDENLDNLIMQNFKDFLTPAYKDKIEKMTADEKRIEMKKMAVKKAKDWYMNESDGWKRLTGIVDALYSDDARRQILALQYLRYDNTKCAGLSIETYLDELKSRIVYLSKSKITRISEQAIYILNDTDFEFIRIKSSN